MILIMPSVSAQEHNNKNSTHVFFGDTHLHTKLSPDAFANLNRTVAPDDAYRFAKGLPIVHPGTGAIVKLNTPLDFLAVTDHAEYMGIVSSIFESHPKLMATKTGKRYQQMMLSGKGRDMFYELLNAVTEGKPIEEINTADIRSSIWQVITNSADKHNQPGKFTTLIGWEWTSMPNGGNLHRVILTDSNSDKAKEYLPYSLFDSQDPEDLWSWLDKTSKQVGINFVAIPHNSNISKGLMFARQDSQGKPITAAYAQQRMLWEPVVEMTQVKGDSETTSLLSPNDEFAEFETFSHIMSTDKTGQELNLTENNYARSALKMGLEIENSIGSNPYKFGMIGSTDSHTGLSTSEEDNFQGKYPRDGGPKKRSEEIIPGIRGIDMSAAGLAAVWAEENTREAIMAAFKRKEVYATTGTRIKLRFFGGWHYQKADVESRDLADTGYKKGVPMGSDLYQQQSSGSPSFLIQAVKDPAGANLDRIQIVKGWINNAGKAHEKVFNVAASEGRHINADGSLEPLGNTVDIETVTYQNTIGSAEIVTVWQDPEFNAKQRAFYYVRVLEIPTPRYSTIDAVALNQKPNRDFDLTIQERAYSSPIWYTPVVK